MLQNINFNKATNIQNTITRNSNFIKSIKNNNVTDKIASKLKTTDIKNVINNKFNDQKSIIEDGIAPWILKAVAKYPKGTFRRVNRDAIVDGEKVKIIFEGIGINFDIISDGREIVKNLALKQTTSTNPQHKGLKILTNSVGKF